VGASVKWRVYGRDINDDEKNKEMEGGRKR
jgi:hypothetical protein